MGDKSSTIYQAFANAENSLLSMFPDIKLQANAPLQVLNHMELTRKATIGTKVSALEKENARMRKQLNLDQGGLDSSGSAAQNQSKETSVEDQFLIDAGLV
jgi:cell shape-determining protein MreC